MIKNVVFDLGRVIYTFWPREDLKNLGFDKKREDLFMSRVFGGNYWVEMDRGTYTINELLPMLTREFPDMADDIKLVFDGKWADRVIQIIPENLEFYYEVKNRGFRVYILSNFPSCQFAHVRARDEFLNDADGIVVSAHEKLIKPDPAIYQCLLGRYNLVPQETIFIDDMPQNIEAAEKLNIKGIVFKDLDDCKMKFEEMIK